MALGNCVVVAVLVVAILLLAKLFRLSSERARPQNPQPKMQVPARLPAPPRPKRPQSQVDTFVSALLKVLSDKRLLYDQWFVDVNGRPVKVVLTDTGYRCEHLVGPPDRVPVARATIMLEVLLVTLKPQAVSAQIELMTLDERRNRPQAHRIVVYEAREAGASECYLWAHRIGARQTGFAENGKAVDASEEI